jgi:hypothetical protein
LGSGYACDDYFDCEELSWDEGDCIEAGDVCTMDDGTDGVYSCDYDCVADTLADGSCDDALSCLVTDWDGGDCDAPEAAPGIDCETSTGAVGVLDCELSCSTYPTWLGDGVCDDTPGGYGYFACEELDWDAGDCMPDPGFECTMEDGSAGIYGCDGDCWADTLEDTTCDEHFDCYALDYDAADCEPPAIGEECTTEFGSTGVIDCTGLCTSSYSLGSGYACDAYFDCPELGWDEGDCIGPGDECLMEDGTDGVFDCEDNCVADTLGDGSCDLAFECMDAGWDGGDCSAPSCGDTDLGSATGEVASGTADESWKSIYDGECGSSGGKETSFMWAAPSDGTYCVDTYGSGFDTVIRIFDATCSEEMSCDDDGSEWASYPGGLVSKLEFTAIAAETLVFMLDAYSSSTTLTEYVLTIEEGSCS